MVETRSMSKAVTDLTTTTATEVARTEHDRLERSPRSVRVATNIATESVSALPTSAVTQTLGPTAPSTSRSCTGKDPVDRPSTSLQHEGNAQTKSHGNHSVYSKQSVSNSRSSRSSTTIRAQKLAVEAEAMQRRVERERKLAERERELARLDAERERELARLDAEREREIARLETEAEQTQLQAKLAALDARDKSTKSRSSCFSSCNSERRTATWVAEQHANMTMAAPKNTPGAAPTDTLGNIRGPPLQSPVPTNTVPFLAPKVNQHAVQSAPAPIANHYLKCEQQKQVDPIAKLALAISSLSDRPKKPELLTFSGEVGRWMAFKSSYERTKINFSPAENLTRLNTAIRGPAYQSVASLLWTSHDSDDVIRALEQTYARPEILVAREVAELRSCSKLCSPKDLNALANKLRNFVTTIKLLNQHDYLYSPELFRCILLKLSEHTIARFTDFAAICEPEITNIAKLELLSRFLLTEADKQLKFNFVSDSTFKPQNPTITTKLNLKKETIHATVSSGNSPECSYCKQGTHNIRTCKTFLSLSIDDRWRWVRDTKVCYRCLKSNPHTWNNCRSKRCGVTGCTRRHNALLHGKPIADASGASTSHAQCNLAEVPPNIPTTSNEIEPSINIANTYDTSINTTGSSHLFARSRGLLKTLPVMLEGPDGEYETVALLDEGSTATLIDGDVAARIGATPTRQERLRIDGVGGMSRVVDVSYIKFYIRGRNLSERYLVENARAIKPLGLRVQYLNNINIAHYSHLSDLTTELSHSNVTPTVLIGAPDWHLSLSREVRCGKKNEPVASKTLLGWVLHGTLSVSSKPLEFINHVNDNLEALIKSQYEIDSLGITKNVPRPNSDHQRALDIIETSARQLLDGRYEVGLPWRENLPKNIPDSYPQALTRLKALERLMSKDSVFAAAYKRFISDIVTKGYAETCDPETYYKRSPNASCVNMDGTIRWYLPTFGVVHPQKKKLRVVHDAAAVTKNVSLNTMLLQGPDLLCSLLDILFRFREGAVALTKCRH